MHLHAYILHGKTKAFLRAVYSIVHFQRGNFRLDASVLAEIRAGSEKGTPLLYVPLPDDGDDAYLLRVLDGTLRPRSICLATPAELRAGPILASRRTRALMAESGFSLGAPGEPGGDAPEPWASLRVPTQDSVELWCRWLLACTGDNTCGTFVTYAQRLSVRSQIKATRERSP